MDALGWCILASLLVLAVVAFLHYLRRADLISTWPTAVATVTEIESHTGAPLPKYGITANHCKVYYAFAIDGKTYEGWFLLQTKERGFADDTGDRLRGKQLTVRYDPKFPIDSSPVDSWVLGKPVLRT